MGHVTTVEQDLVDARPPAEVQLVLTEYDTVGNCRAVVARTLGDPISKLHRRGVKCDSPHMFGFGGAVVVRIHASTDEFFSSSRPSNWYELSRQRRSSKTIPPDSLHALSPVFVLPIRLVVRSLQCAPPGGRIAGQRLPLRRDSTVHPYDSSPTSERAGGCEMSRE